MIEARTMTLADGVIGRLFEHLKTRNDRQSISRQTMAMGQGIATSYAQLAVDVFGVPLERIRILQGDTDRANGFGSAGSRSIFVGGSGNLVVS